MSVALQVLLVLVWLQVLPLLGFGGREPMRHRVAKAEAPSSCAGGRPLLADFDSNGVEDRVLRAEQLGLWLQLNGRHPVLLSDASACRLGAFDLDRDLDLDLVALTEHGELEVWSNENGTLRELPPERGPTPMPAYSAIRTGASVPNFIFLTADGVVHGRRLDACETLPSSRHSGFRDFAQLGSVCRESTWARPPPIN